MPRLQYVLRGIKSEEAKQCHHQQCQHLPVTPDILTKMHKIMIQNPNDFNYIVFWSASSCVSSVSSVLEKLLSQMPHCTIRKCTWISKTYQLMIQTLPLCSKSTLKPLRLTPFVRVSIYALEKQAIPYAQFHHFWTTSWIVVTLLGFYSDSKTVPP